MAQLNQFNGGLNTRLAPHLINVNEAQVYSNIDNTRVSLKPVKGNTDEVQTVNEFMHNFNGLWISSTTYRTYQEFQEKLYYSDGLGVPQKSSDGILYQNLGILKPSITPITAINGAGVLTGTLQYCYTYYNTVDGTESMPSEYSIGLVTVAQQVDISVTASTDSQVTNIRLYRLGGNITEMQLVVELLNTTATYLDNITDLDIVGSVLDSYLNGQAPTGLKYLTENNAMLFGTSEDKLYYSEIAFVNNWSPFNFIDFDGPITGIGPVPNGLLVFTKFKTYIVTGTSPSTLSKYLLNGSQGCVEHRAIQFVNNTLIWLSTDGICISTGGEVLVVSRDKLGKLALTGVTDSEVYDDVYYLGYSGGMLSVDFRFGIIFKNLSTLVSGLHVYDDILYYSHLGSLYSLGTNVDSLSLSYRSPKLSDGQVSNLKSYKSFYVNCIGELSISIYIDDILVITKSIDDTTSEILVPQLTRKGYYIEFEVTGTGELLELQYIVEGRQNGK